MRVEGTAMKILNIKGDIVMDHVEEGEKAEKNPEIDRKVLRDILVDSVEPGSIKWGRKLVRVAPVANDKFDLHFADGVVEEGYDLVIGAEGTWSRVRPLLTDVKPYYSGITCLETRIEDVDTKFPDIGARVGRGSCCQFGESKGLMAQRNGDGSVRVYVMLRVPEDYLQTRGVDWENRELVVEELMKNEVKGWDEGGHEWLKRGGNFTVRPLYMLPVGVEWTTRSG